MSYPHIADALESLAQKLRYGCGDHHCKIQRAHGLGTNGGCKCSRLPDCLVEVAAQLQIDMAGPRPLTEKGNAPLPTQPPTAELSADMLQEAASQFNACAARVGIPWRLRDADETTCLKIAINVVLAAMRGE